MESLTKLQRWRKCQTWQKLDQVYSRITSIWEALVAEQMLSCVNGWLGIKKFHIFISFKSVAELHGCRAESVVMSNIVL